MIVEEPLTDIVLRILILGPLSLFWIVCIVRFIGLRSFSKMTAFDFITTVATGSLLGSAASAGDWTTFSVSCGAVLVLLGVQALVALGRISSAAWISVLENEPLLLMREGIMNVTNMEKSRVTELDLLAKLREANVLKFDEVRAVVLETTGDISVLHGNVMENALLRGVRES